MKKTITILAILIVTLGNLSAQYQVAYKQAKAQERKGLYYKAILSYNAAAVSRDKPANNDLEKRINFCASKLNGLKIEAEKAKNEAQKALMEAKEQKKRAEQEKQNAEKALIEAKKQKKLANEANNKAQKIIDAFYFYDDKFALAYKSQRFGFIDKQGNVKINYQYQEALPFNPKTGLARVVSEYDSYLIDTMGVQYGLVKNVEELCTFVKAIDLKLNELKKMPAEIFKNQQLEMIFFNNNSLTKLPPEIGNLEYLKILDVNENFVLKTVPKQIGNLKNLTYLSLNYNQLASLPKEIGNLESLTYLSLNENQFATLPKEIGNLESLTYLSLNKNQLATLPKQIGNLVNLTELNLHENQLTTLPEEIKLLKNLTRLSLYGNNFSEEEKERIKKMLPNCEIEF